MMRVDRAPTPRGFVANVFRPGRMWLAENPYPMLPKALWTNARLADGKTCSETLVESYHHICAYSLFRGRVCFDVEHFKPKHDKVYRNLAYCWLNFRLADSRLNAWKHTTDLPDPFCIGIDACKLNFAKEAIIEVDKAQAGWKALDAAIAQLRLNVGALKTERYEAYTQYLSDDDQEHIGVVRLARYYPFVAYEMLRQGCLKPEDVCRCRDILHEIGFSWA